MAVKLNQRDPLDVSVAQAWAVLSAATIVSGKLAQFGSRLLVPVVARKA